MLIISEHVHVNAIKVDLTQLAEVTETFCVKTLKVLRDVAFTYTKRFRRNAY